MVRTHFWNTVLIVYKRNFIVKFNKDFNLWNDLYTEVQKGNLQCIISLTVIFIFILKILLKREELFWLSSIEKN